MRTASSYICQQCGYQASSYLGRCPECNSWGSLVEQVVSAPKGNSIKKQHSIAEIVNLKDIEKKDYDRIKTGIEEFDRVLGGGIVPGSVILVAGDPGIGKSTLLSQLAINVNNTFYVAGEESPRQIKMRVERINPEANFAILPETDVDSIVQALEAVKPLLAVVDSIQTIETSDLVSAAGSIGQVRECAHRLQRIAKSLHIAIFIVGHITKEGAVAGPKTLEHLVDAVLLMEGDPSTELRLLRGIKNRFGPTDEVGVFEMKETGMEGISNPSKVFLDQKVNAPGSSVVAAVAGLRPMLLEIQALVTKSFLPVPRRVGTGIDNNKLQMLVAVLQKRLKLNLFDKDIFVNVTGGMKIFEPAADLGICLAIISSLNDKPIAPRTVSMGEVGLLGELRNIKQADKRAGEAKKLGYTNVISPKNARFLTEAVKLATI